MALSAALAFAPPGLAKTLRYASRIDPGTMDLHSMPSLYNNRVLSPIYDHLVGRDESFRPAPQLALSWTPLEAGRGWRFKLRPGVQFHEGTPFTAEDVAFTVRRSPACSRGVGIRVSYRPAPFNTFLPRLTAGEMNLYVVGWTAASADPEGVLVPIVHTRGNGLGEYNFGLYSNPKADAAIDKGSLEFDFAKRSALFTEAMLAVDADAGFIPLVTRNITWAMRTQA